MRRIGDKLVGEIVQSSDYTTMLCGKCEEQVEIDYAGQHGHVAILKFTCSKCGDLGTWKMNRSGPGFLQHMARSAPRA